MFLKVRSGYSRHLYSLYCAAQSELDCGRFGFRYGAADGDQVLEKRLDVRKPTVVDDAVLQQSLTQVNPFLLVACLTDFHQPGHKLTGDTQKTTLA